MVELDFEQEMLVWSQLLYTYLLGQINAEKVNEANQRFGSIDDFWHCEKDVRKFINMDELKRVFYERILTETKDIDNEKIDKILYFIENTALEIAKSVLKTKQLLYNLVDEQNNLKTFKDYFPKKEV